MGKIGDLERELATLKKKREDASRVKRLKKQIKAEKFASTRGGKVFNAIGDFGLNVGKKILTPAKKQVGSKSSPSKPQKQAKPMDINEIIARLPQ